ncbi:MAG: hypothetical protein WBA12_11105 [Catalinimonas sp.]
MGTLTFAVDLMVRYGGTYALNPVRAKAMCFPTFRSNNEALRVTAR